MSSFLLGLWVSLAAIAFLLAGTLTLGFLGLALALGLAAAGRVIWRRSW